MTRVHSFAGASGMLLALVLLRFVAFSGTTGKITGQVIDKDSREALVGVNITVEGTVLGGATDVNGSYTILNVPPGTYNLKVSLVGYGITLMAGIRVYIDQTARVNVELRQQTIDMGEVVTTVQRKLVKEDVSSSVVSLNNQEVRSLPVSSVTEVAGLQAGVEAGLVIRGGAADQSLFLLDGVTMRDPRNNQPISSVPLSAIQEVSIERGGFLAEYGQIRSGIFNVVTKEGALRSYTLSATARVSPPEKKYFGISPFDPNSMWMRPYLDPAVAWTGTASGAWDASTQRQYPAFEGWNAVSQRLMSDNDPTNDLTPAGAQRLFMWQHRKRENFQPDYNLDFGIGGPVIPDANLSDKLGDLRFFLAYRNQRSMYLIPLSRDQYFEDSWSLRLTSDISPTMKLDLTGTLGRTKTVAVNGTEQATSTDYMNTTNDVAAMFSLQPFTSSSRLFVDSYNSLTDIKNYSLAGQFTHSVSSSLFYDVRLEHVYRKYDTYRPPLRDPSRIYEIFPGYYTDETPYGWSPLATSTLDGMLLGGHTATARDSSWIMATTLKGNVTMQADRHNQLKAGVEFVYNQLHLDYGVENLAFPESNNFVHEARFPVRAAAFIQDKLEFEGFVANLGLRLDYSDANVNWWDVSTFDKAFFTSAYNPLTPFPTTKSKADWTLSPRLGISHPITENAKLYFNYGHFRQLPTYEQLLRYSRNVTGALRNIGDPNLLMASTIAYELGFDYSLAESFLLQIAGFYRDIKDQQDFTTFISNATSGNFSYIKPNNNSYSDIRGLEITVRKAAGSFWSGFINYTYQSTKSGAFNRDRVYQDPTDQRKYDLDTRILYQYRPIPTPYARMNLMLVSPPDFGPSFAGQSLLGDWMLSILGDWRSGGFGTWNPNSDPSIADNVAMVDYLNFNLRISKSFSIGPTRVILFADVSNLFDTKRLNLNSFFDANDQVDYYNSLHLPTSSAYGNIPGDDRIGAYREYDVAYQPMKPVGSTAGMTDPLAIYYLSGKYYNYVGGAWTEVDAGKLESLLDTKAYIDMPNQSSFAFLNPSQIFFGITLQLEL